MLSSGFKQLSLIVLKGFTYRQNIGVSVTHPNTHTHTVPCQVSLITNNFYRSSVFKMQERLKNFEATAQNILARNKIENGAPCLWQGEYNGNETCADPISIRVTTHCGGQIPKVPLLLLSEVSCFLLFLLANQAKR